MQLQNPDVARAVVQTISEDGGAWQAHSYVVMPNHVHLLVTASIALHEALRLIKGRSARRCNLILGLTGSEFWQRESYDHVVRDREEFERIRSYVEMNPVRAGLVREAGDYPWSSAKRG